MRLRKIKAFPNYAVTSTGIVYSCCYGRFRKLIPYQSPKGYLSVYLCRNGKRYGKRIHCLVLETFVGPCPPGKQSRHFPDPDPTNNNLSNLQWATQSRNCKDKVIHGTDNRGEKNSSAVLTERKVKKIRRLHKAGHTNLASLGRRFSVSRPTIARIVQKRIWRHV